MVYKYICDLSERHYAMAIYLGKGNASQGVRGALETAFLQFPNHENLVLDRFAAELSVPRNPKSGRIVKQSGRPGRPANFVRRPPWEDGGKGWDPETLAKFAAYNAQADAEEALAAKADAERARKIGEEWAKYPTEYPAPRSEWDDVP